jgi:tRNA(Ile)-lysidine synthase
MAGSRKSRSTERLQAAVAGCLHRHLKADERLVVALSGGVDSVVLLHAICSVRPPDAAIHVHHGLNSEADRWTDFCHDLCMRWTIPLMVERVDVERDSRDGLEAAARRARHGVFDRVAADRVALGHHRGDRAETMLFNLLRGAGVRGAGAMRESNGRLLRPLLSVGRDDIADYAASFGLDWVEDASNADVRYSRNFLRHRVLPVVCERFPAAEARLASAAARFGEAAVLLDDLALLDMGGRLPEFPLDLDVLGRLSEPRARNVLRFLLALHGVGVPSEERLAEALRQLLTASNDRHPAIAFGDWCLRRVRGKVLLEPF